MPGRERGTRVARGSGMIGTRPHRWLFLPMWLVVMGALLAAGLYFGYRWPEITATLVLISLVVVWMVAERFTTRWWY
jgi:hypothetical protein